MNRKDIGYIYSYILDNVFNIGEGLLIVPKSGSRRPIPAHVLKFDFMLTSCVNRHTKYYTYILILIQIVNKHTCTYLDILYIYY